MWTRLILCGAFGISVLAFGRQDSSRIDTLRSQARQAFDAAMAREKSGDCPNADNTYQFNICYGKAVAETDKNFKAYEDAIRNLLSLVGAGKDNHPPGPGPAGPELTPEQSAAEFDRVEQLWQAYLDAACTAAFHRFGGGTGGPSAEMECHLRTVRAHMRELDATYYMLVHHCGGCIPG
jgi:uncharacterized protein YecT (DUF1311 family)